MAIVMIADDDPVAAGRITQILQREGFAVVHAVVPDDQAPASIERIRMRLQELRMREPGQLQFGDLGIDLTTRQARRGVRPIELSPREFDVLAYLVRRAGEVVQREALFEAVWRYRHERASNVVEVHVARLRRKLDAPPMIHTVRGVGYVFGTVPS